MRRDGSLLLRKRMTSGSRSKVARRRGSRRWGSHWGSRWGSRRPEGCQLGNSLRSRPTKMSLLTVSLLTASRLMANLITKMSLLTVSLLTANPLTANLITKMSLLTVSRLTANPLRVISEQLRRGRG